MSSTIDLSVLSTNFYQKPHDGQNSLSFHPALSDVPNKRSGSVLIYIHGGGFWQGDRTDDDYMLDKNFGDGDNEIFNVNHRLAFSGNTDKPINIYPTAISDIINAYNWIIKRLGKDANIIFMGNSSGGNLALEVGIRLNKPAIALSPILLFKEFLNDEKYKNDPPIQKKDDWEYGPGGFYSKDSNGKLHKECSFASYNKWIIKNYSGGDKNIVNNLSITNRINDSVKGNHFFIANSTDELVPKEQMEIVSKKLKKHGANVKTVLLNGIKHGKSYLPEIKNVLQEFINNLSARQNS